FQMVADTMREVLGRVDWRPEESTLFTFGGNGPAFACGVAERLGISQVYVFDLGSVFSAFGSSISDIVHVYEHGLNVSLAAVKGHRDAIWGRVSDPATLFTWEALHPGHEVSGGAILESAWTTYIVLPGWVLRIDEYGNGHLQRR